MRNKPRSFQQMKFLFVILAPNTSPAHLLQKDDVPKAVPSPMSPPPAPATPATPATPASSASPGTPCTPNSISPSGIVKRKTGLYLRSTSVLFFQTLTPAEDWWFFCLEPFYLITLLAGESWLQILIISQWGGEKKMTACSKILFSRHSEASTLYLSLDTS